VRDEVCALMVEVVRPRSRFEADLTRIASATVGLEIAIELPGGGAYACLGGAVLLREGVELVDQALGMNPAQPCWPTRNCPASSLMITLSRRKPWARDLFDHLVGAKQNRWGYRKAKRLGGLEVHGHLKFCRQLNG
jgi:hypothetical protein